MSDVDQDRLASFEKEIGFVFKDKELLQTVFVHRSYLNEHRGYAGDHNERLEFLGDAVLELVVTEYLYRNYPNPEGELTNWRSALVKGETLAELARENGFPSQLMLSHGEEKSGGRDKGYLLANAFEAFIGALYLDQGSEACVKFIHNTVLARLPNILENQLYIDPKSRLQEYTQAHMGITPTYQVIKEEGPDHEKVFEVAVLVGDTTIGVGQGSSKQGAQIAAAESALKAVTAKGE
jgi:ribonuclease-3